MIKVSGEKHETGEATAFYSTDDAGLVADYFTNIVHRWYAAAAVAEAGTWADAIGSCDMTLQGNATVSTATPGLTCDGTGDYALGGALSITAATDWSISLWAKTTATGARILVAYSENEVIDPTNEGDFYVYAPNDLRWGGIGARAEIDTNTNISDGAWHSIVITKNATTVTMYLDGSTTATHTHSVSNNAYAYTNATFRIGDDMNVSYYSGDIDDIRIYAECLTAANMKKIYDATAGAH